MVRGRRHRLHAARLGGRARADDAGRASGRLGVDHARAEHQRVEPPVRVDARARDDHEQQREPPPRAGHRLAAPVRKQALLRGRGAVRGPGGSDRVGVAPRGRVAVRAAQRARRRQGSRRDRGDGLLRDGHVERGPLRHVGLAAQGRDQRDARHDDVRGGVAERSRGRLGGDARRGAPARRRGHGRSHPAGSRGALRRGGRGPRALGDARPVDGPAPRGADPLRPRGRHARRRDDPPRGCPPPHDHGARGRRGRADGGVVGGAPLSRVACGSVRFERA